MLVATSNVDETELEISDDMLERIESHTTVTLKKIPQDDSSTSDMNLGQLQLADPRHARYAMNMIQEETALELTCTAAIRAQCPVGAQRYRRLGRMRTAVRRAESSRFS